MLNFFLRKYCKNILHIIRKSELKVAYSGIQTNVTGHDKHLTKDLFSENFNKLFYIYIKPKTVHYSIATAQKDMYIYT